MEKALNIQFSNAPEKASTPLLKAANFCLAHDEYLRKRRDLPLRPRYSLEVVWEPRLVTPTLGPYLLPHILNPVHDRYTELKLYVREDTPSDFETGLINGQHDLILTTLPIMSKNLSLRPYFGNRLN